MADEYEREFMVGKGEVLHRHKATLPGWAFWIAAGLPAGGAAVVGLVTALPALAMIGGGALYAVLMTLLLIATGVTRIQVSEGLLQVQMGMGGVEIPIEEIKHVDLGESGTRARGIGKRILLDGTRIYNMLGDPRRAVRIRRAGHPPTVLVCEEPEALLDAIQEARSRAGAKVRVADVPEELEHEVPAAAGEAKKNLTAG